jgi:neuromedin U receptor 2
MNEISNLSKIFNFSNHTIANETLSTALTPEDMFSIIKLRYIVYGFICLPISVIGVLLNSLTIIILLHPRMRNFSTNIYLTALSVANIVCLINYIFLYSLRYLISYENFKLQVLDSLSTKYNKNGLFYENFLNMILWAWSPIFTTFQLFAIYLTCSVTVDRWIYLYFPFKADRLLTKKTTITVILCILLFCIIYNVPRWFEVTYEKYFDDRTNTTLYYAGPTEFGKNPTVRTILNYYVYIISVYCLPFLVLLIVNIGIIHKLIATKERKSVLLGVKKVVKKNDSSIKNENESVVTKPLVKKKSAVNFTNKIDPKITFMILAVVISFFICQFPYLLVTILSVKHENTKFLHKLKLISDSLATVSCSVNFLIYCVFGQKFRETANNILFSKPIVGERSTRKRNNV